MNERPYHPSEPVPPPPARPAEGGFNPGAALAGILFITLGILFLIDAVDVASIRRDLVWPAVLIALGIVVMLSALRRRDRA